MDKKMYCPFCGRELKKNLIVRKKTDAGKYVAYECECGYARGGLSKYVDNEVQQEQV